MWYHFLLVVAIIAICIVTMVVFFKYVKSDSIQKMGALLLVAFLGIVAICAVTDRYAFFQGRYSYDYSDLPYHTRPNRDVRSEHEVGFFHIKDIGYYLEAPWVSYSDGVKKINKHEYIQAIDTNKDTITLDFHTVLKYGYNKTDLIILVETQDEQTYWLRPYPTKINSFKYDGKTYRHVTYLHSLIDEKMIQTDAYHWVTLGEPKFIYVIMLLLRCSLLFIPFLIGGLLVFIPLGIITRKHQYDALKNKTNNRNIYIPILIWSFPLAVFFFITLPFRADFFWVWAILFALLLLFYICIFIYLKIWNKCLQYIHSVLQEKAKVETLFLLPTVHIGLWLSSTFIYCLSILFFSFVVGTGTSIVDSAIEQEVATKDGFFEWIMLIDIVSYIVLEICLHWQIYHYKRETE